METLRTYLNSLAMPEQALFAQRCGTTVGYLRKMLSIGGLLREKVCTAIELASAGAVSRKELRPDDWRAIWPELANSEPNSPVALSRQAQAATQTVAQGVANV